MPPAQVVTSDRQTVTVPTVSDLTKWGMIICGINTAVVVIAMAVQTWVLAAIL